MTTKSRSKPRASAKKQSSNVIVYSIAGVICLGSIAFGIITKMRADESTALASENMKIARQENMILDSLVNAMQKELLQKDSLIKALRSSKK